MSATPPDSGERCIVCPMPATRGLEPGKLLWCDNHGPFYGKPDSGERDAVTDFVLGDDAPEGHAWLCPDCESWATLHGNARYHMTKMEHGVPSLGPQPARIPDRIPIPRSLARRILSALEGCRGWVTRDGGDLGALADELRKVMP